MIPIYLRSSPHWQVQSTNGLDKKYMLWLQVVGRDVARMKNPIVTGCVREPKQAGI